MRKVKNNPGSIPCCHVAVRKSYAFVSFSDSRFQRGDVLLPSSAIIFFTSLSLVFDSGYEQNRKQTAGLLEDETEGKERNAPQENGVSFSLCNIPPHGEVERMQQQQQRLGAPTRLRRLHIQRPPKGLS